jgi:hypothetical protein
LKILKKKNKKKNRLNAKLLFHRTWRFLNMSVRDPADFLGVDAASTVFAVGEVVSSLTVTAFFFFAGRSVGLLSSLSILTLRCSEQQK